MDTVRTFIGLRLDETVRRSLAGLSVALGEALPAVRWVDASRLHLTLRFYGNLEPERFEALREALCSFTPGSAFELQFCGLGAFPSLSRPRVLWVGVREPSGLLLTLRDRLQTLSARLGFAPEREANFHPHITIGRIRGRLDGLGAAIRPYLRAEFGVQRVRELLLFESQLAPTAPLYRVRMALPLAMDIDA